MSTNEQPKQQQSSSSIRNSIALISEQPWTSCYTQFEFDLAIAVQAASRNSNCEMPTGCSACCLLLWQLQLHLQLRLPLLLPFVIIIISSSSAAAAQQDTHSNIVTSCHSHCDQVRSSGGGTLGCWVSLYERSLNWTLKLLLFTGFSSSEKILQHFYTFNKSLKPMNHL